MEDDSNKNAYYYIVHALRHDYWHTPAPHPNHTLRKVAIETYFSHLSALWVLQASALMIMLSSNNGLGIFYWLLMFCCTYMAFWGHHGGRVCLVLRQSPLELTAVLFLSIPYLNILYTVPYRFYFTISYFWVSEIKSISRKIRKIQFYCPTTKIEECMKETISVVY